MIRRATAALIVLAGAACGRGNDAPDAAAAQATIAVTVQAARLDTVRDTLVVPGQVVPSAAADQVVSAPEPAEIVEIPKGEGTSVQAGEVLVRFEIASITAEIQLRQIEVVEATGRYDAARTEAARLASLHERGLVARNMLESAKSALSVAEAALGQAKSSLDAAKSAQERTIVRARFGGLVTKVLHKPGERVAGGSSDPVLRLVDPTRLQISAQVPLAQLERLQPGQVASVQTAAGPAGTATVTLRLGAATPTATTGEVRLEIVPPTALTIDTPVQLDLQIEERRDVVVVPLQAVQKDGTVTFVWIAGDDRQAHRREVRVGLSAGGLTQIVSGVAVGERVILTGIAELIEGTTITFRTS